MAKRRAAAGLRVFSEASGDPRGLSQRQLRVGELLRHAIAEVLARETIRDPVVADAAVTITEVLPAPDLKSATCYIMPLGGENLEAVRAALEQLAPWLSSQVSRRVRLKYAPALRFAIDSSFDEADRIKALLKRPDVAADLSSATDRDEESNGA